MAFDWIDLQHRAHREFADRLAAVTDWSAPTPDTDWDIDTLVRHVTEEQQWVPYLLQGMTVEEAQEKLEPLGDDLVGEWRRHSKAATDAWASVPFDATVQLSYDTVTVEDYLKEQVSDVTIHSWDLARAAGADEKLDDELVEAAWSIFEPQLETLAASGLFADPIQVDESAPLQLRLLAITGRDAR
ncbi:TIGR03086 family metal-binding protein [Glaciihabitans sp. dw_435]|uniref:TIGR03086 family metal-binding protein n=1 Tax=Glaciihabitans sp. dw_435 TaxID=2720081 RepID=UPI001BD3C299|nr:TIGR03086 family metal-binding protein [Glaciihabitans sp. dw_435]